jgi:hypothetical protein
VADDERKLPDLVSRVRTVYDGAGVEEARKDARGLGDDLDKAANGEGFKQASNSLSAATEQLKIWKKDLAEADVDDPGQMHKLAEGVAGWQAEVDRRSGLAKEALASVGAEGEAAGSSIATGITAGATALGALVTVARAAFEAFNQAGAEGKLSDDQAKQYRELTDATNDLKASLNDLAVDGGAAIAALVDPLAKVAAELTDIGNAKILGSEKSLSSSVLEAVNPVLLLGDALDKLGVGGDAAAETEEQLAARTKIANDEFARQQEEADKSAKALDDLAEAQVDAVRADEELEDRRRSLTDAQKDAADAEAKVNDLRASGGRTAEESIRAAERLADAQERLADAHRKVESAVITLADKEEDLREAQFRQGVQSEEAIKAQRVVDTARLNLAGARSDVGDAETGVNRAQKAFDDAGPKALADAEAKLVEAHDKLEDAAFAVADAQVEQARKTAEANQQAFNGRDATIKYKDALGDLADQVGGPIGQRIDAFAGKVRNVNEAMAAMTAQIPTIEPLFGMDFASGAARTSASPALPANVLNQTNNITVPTTQQLAGAILDEVSWGRSHYE